MAQFDITLAGEITIDLLMYGLPEELPVEREFLATSMALTLGGSSAITAHNLAVLGSRIGFIPQLGADPFTDLCLQPLLRAGVDLSHAVAPKPEIGTGLTVLLQHERSRRALTYSGTISDLRYEDLDLAYLASGRHFHLSSFFLQRGLRNDVPKLLATMRRAGLTTSLDTNDDPANLWEGPIAETLTHLDILMPNEREACRLANEANLDDAINKLSEMIPMLVIKRGAAGALVMHGGLRYEAPGHHTEVIDVIGAGDSFNAGFLHAFVHGAGLRDCLALGNACGAYSTTASGGTQAFSMPQRMQEFFESLGVVGQIVS
ncbi:carbohydrate kinase family protein [Tunturiibacter gelidoferens]|uniref:Sugar/nucleoside kinase (Ribokinase family) n=2 Tax=Tunturiibacter TaxID=3154218 RepID=A0A7Y9NPI3_9BACT|nr:sugar kinase [Edaphobacter lichenicola]MBB5338181.1 sugar/nucleoside kinase (ribokinase family) [Edaphobacter lichenicola]NYF52565.1 sugar/nucleoside kinase (ribokinase family) [Edaphobacter lichenicola]